ncbi:MAG: hypothetical protein ACUVSC_13490 [Candidatus Fervidibacter sp.]|uniref:hypothetical protein n=1 Tax=Candidatus Fervidibacter sp. TaxID=3100871 RepID=UPI00404B11FD
MEATGQVKAIYSKEKMRAMGQNLCGGHHFTMLLIAIGIREQKVTEKSTQAGKCHRYRIGWRVL